MSSTGRRASPALALAALALLACQMPFLPRKRESVVPERSELLGLQGPVEIAVDSPVFCRNGVIRTDGQATNFTGRTLESCTVQLRFLDHNGAVVGSAMAYTMSGVEPGQAWNFEAVCTSGPIADKYYAVEIGRVTVVPKE